MNGSRQRYRLDDYLQDKASRVFSPLGNKGSPLVRNEQQYTSKWERPLPVVKPPHTVPNPVGDSQSAVDTGAGGGTTKIVSPDTGVIAGGGVLTQSQMTTAYTKQLMENALSNLLAMQNRKFKYDAHSSPLYSIVQKQAEENARLASGRAYAQAKSATGGYGSSYATLAADEAGRQAMRELDDQQLALYEAARSEFEAENASALDWYNMTKQLYEDAYVLEQDEKQKAALEERELTETAISAAQELQNVYGTDFSEKAQREYLASKGYSQADIDSAIEAQRKIAGAVTTDYKAGTITDAVAQSQSLDEAYRQGTLTVEEYDAAKAQNSKVIMDSVYKGMERIEDTDYAALGISDEEWGAMKDGEKKLAVFDRVGQMVKNGSVNETDYYKLLYNDIQEELASEDYQKSKNKTRDVVDIAIVIQDLYDNGYMSEDSYKDIVYNELMPNIEDDKTFKTIVYYSKDYDSYGRDTKMAIKLMDEQRIIPNIGKYNIEEQQMLLNIARGYNGSKIKRKK